MRSFDTRHGFLSIVLRRRGHIPVSKLYLPFTVLIQPFQTAMDASTPILAIQTILTSDARRTSTGWSPCVPLC